MKLTVIPSDNSVYVDGKFQKDLNWKGTPSGVHALQWNNDSGWIEYSDGRSNQQITNLPKWALNAAKSWEDANNAPAPQPPVPTAEDNKMTAIGFLQMTDWVNQPDVRDQNSAPYLINGNDFDVFRIEIRKIAINSVDGYIDWPVKPNAVWSE